MKPINFAIVALSAISAVQAHAQAPAPPVLNSTDVSSYCGSFVRGPDAVWITTKPVTIQRPTGRLIFGRGVKVETGKPMGGMDLAAALEVQCVKKAGG